MIKSIKLNVPEYGVNVTQEFGKHTLIEEKNGFGKTTLLYALLSIYTGKFRTAKIPACTAAVETDDGPLILNKGLWVGKTGEPSPLARYVLTGEFFNLNTPEQRASIVGLLGIDYPAYMKKTIPAWHDKMETELNRTMTFNEGKEQALLEDIVKLRETVIAYEKDPVTVKDNFAEIERAYRDSIKDVVAKHEEAVKFNSSLVVQQNRFNVDFAMAKNKVQNLLEKYSDAVADLNCSSCGQPLPKEKREAVIQGIKDEGVKARAELDALQNKAMAKPMEVPERPGDKTLGEKALAGGMELEFTSQEELRRKADYESAKSTLASKEKELRGLGELETKELLELISQTKFAFTKELNETVKALGLEIELFKTQKNGDVVESFVVSKNGIPYADLSNGNKAVLQFKVAKVFAEKLGVPFVLMDEVGTLSNESLKEILADSGDVQVIMARATPFAKKEVK